MTILEHKIILRLLSHEQIAELFPAQKGISGANDFKGICRIKSNDQAWVCTRQEGHTGIHVRHRLYTYHKDVPFAWLNENKDEL